MTVVNLHDKAEIEAKTQALTEASGKLAERAYAQQQQPPGGGAGEAAGEKRETAKEEVVDAEFEEVDDNKR